MSYTWNILDSSSQNWIAIAVSGNGQYVAGGVDIGFVFISSNYGSTWIQAPLAQMRWYGIAISATGQYFYAAADNDYLYQSIDYGKTWNVISNEKHPWFAISCDSSGQHVTGVAIDGFAYYSTNFGKLFIVSIAASSQSPPWYAVANSYSSSYVVAGTKNSYIFVSSNYGKSFYPTSFVSFWSAVAISGDGQYIFATEENGFVYSSNDYGKSFSSTSNSLGSLLWQSITTDINGQVVAAVGFGIYLSSDNGGSFIVSSNQKLPLSPYISIASSADASFIYTMEYGGYIYQGISLSNPTVNSSSQTSGVLLSTVYIAIIVVISSCVCFLSIVLCFRRKKETHQKLNLTPFESWNNQFNKSNPSTSIRNYFERVSTGKDDEEQSSNVDEDLENQQTSILSTSKPTSSPELTSRRSSLQYSTPKKKPKNDNQDDVVWHDNLELSSRRASVRKSPRISRAREHSVDTNSSLTPSRSPKHTDKKSIHETPSSHTESPPRITSTPESKRQSLSPPSLATSKLTTEDSEKKSRRNSIMNSLTGFSTTSNISSSDIEISLKPMPPLPEAIPSKSGPLIIPLPALVNKQPLPLLKRNDFDGSPSRGSFKTGRRRSSSVGRAPSIRLFSEHR